MSVARFVPQQPVGADGPFVSNESLYNSTLNQPTPESPVPTSDAGRDILRMLFDSTVFDQSSDEASPPDGVSSSSE